MFTYPKSSKYKSERYSFSANVIFAVVIMLP